MMLLDSNIVIYAAEPGYDEVRSFIAKHNPVVSVISKVEVLGYHMLSSENLKLLETLFHSLPVLGLTDITIDRAVSLRQQRKMSLGDALIAATALTHDIPVVTANIGDFNWIDGLEVINPVGC